MNTLLSAHSLPGGGSGFPPALEKRSLISLALWPAKRNRWSLITLAGFLAKPPAPQLPQQTLRVEMVDVPLPNAIWRRPRDVAQCT